MGNKKDPASTFSKFFKEESEEIFQQTSNDSREELTFDKDVQVPSLPEAIPAEDPQLKEEWKSIRKFFIASKGGKIPDNITPLHFQNIHTDEYLSQDYPIWISNDKDNNDVPQCIPISQYLSHKITTVFPEGGDGKLIKNLYTGILREITLNHKAGPAEFKDIVNEAAEKVKVNIELRNEDENTFNDQLKKVSNGLTTKGAPLNYSRNAPFFILEATVSEVLAKGQKTLSQKIANILRPLEELLDIESENDPESANPEHLKSSMGFADNYLDFNKLSSVIPESSSEHLSPERIKRIKNVIGTINKKRDLLSTILIQDTLISQDDLELAEIFSSYNIHNASAGNICREASDLFNNNLDEVAKLIKAIRIGELEIQNKYNNEVHEDYFKAFDKDFISEEEAKLCPAVIVITESQVLSNEELKDFSSLLQQNTQIKFVALKTVNGELTKGELDPGTIAVAHRNTYVCQCTALSPQFLFESLEKGISSFSPAVFHIGITEKGREKDQFLNLSAAVESRHFPTFIYNGKLGTAWGSRFDISNNPQVEKNWPEYTYSFKDAEGQEVQENISLTYADFSLLTSSKTNNFKIVPPEFWTEDLIPFTDYLQMSETDRYRKIPFIWTINEEGILSKVAISWDQVSAAAEKQDFWNYLQDCGGVHSYHAEKALTDREEEIRKESEEKITKLNEAHASELEKARRQSAEEAMDHLTSALLDIDSESLISEKGRIKDEIPSKAIDDKEEEEEQSVIADEESVKESESQEEEIISEEPWIETPLCTNCNECIDLNKRMFNYNADKLAFIADPTAGTFAQLVEAAEKCPVGIIHPGKPLNPDEPDLEDLIKRAKKFN